MELAVRQAIQQLTVQRFLCRKPAFIIIYLTTMRQPTERTAALLRELSTLRSRFGWIVTWEDRRVSLIELVTATEDVAAIPSLLNLLFDRSTAVSSATSNGLAKLVDSVPPRELPNLDEEVRSASYWENVEEWNRLRPAEVVQLAMSQESRSSILGLASFHRNGHVREVAVRQLDLIEDGTELQFLLIRLND